MRWWQLDWWLLAIVLGSVTVMATLALWSFELVDGRLVVLALLAYFAAFLGFMTQ
jgi:hypothetical protein